MNVDRRWLGTSVGRIRVLLVAFVLLVAGCAVLGWAFRSHQDAQHAPTGTVALLGTSVPQLLDLGDITESQAHSMLAGLPLIFEPNQGQAGLNPSDARARFVTRGAGYSLFLGSNGATLSLFSGQQPQLQSPHASAKPSPIAVESIEMKLAGANPHASLSGSDPLPGKSNYLLGNDPSRWRQNISQFARVRYQQIYPGIDLVFYGNDGRLEYDFQVHPGFDPAQAELEFLGARRLEVKDGSLVIHGHHGEMRLQAPRVYQEIAGIQQPVDGKFVLRGPNRAGFAVGAYDHSRELVIDPILTFSTYFGGSGDEHSTFVAVDGSFNIYLTGSTTSPNLPATTGDLQATLAGAQNVYVAKITPPLGSLAPVLDFMTYLGGSGTDTPVGIRVDGRGDPYLAGTTSSTNFPTTATTAYQSVPQAGSGGTTHVFATVLKYDGTSLVYSSYLSGNSTDTASGMTTDASGFIYITGTTTSTNAASSSVQFPASTYPNAQPFQPLSNGNIQFFVTKVNPNSVGILTVPYSTYFGGAVAETNPPVAIGGGIAVDPNLNVYFTGTTNYIYSGTSSADFPILNPYQPCLDQAPPSVIVNPATCTYTTPPSAPDAFVAKLDVIPGTPGPHLIWSTYVGGTANDFGNGVALDPGAANVYLVGTTNSTDIGTSVTTLNTSAPFQRCLDAPTATGTCPNTLTTNDAFVARLTNPTPVSTSTTPNNVALNYFSYLGGAGNETGRAIAVDTAAGALITGYTQSADFPVFPSPNPIQSTLNGPQDAFIARLNTATVVGQGTAGSWANYFGGSGTDQGTGVALDVNQNAYFAGDTNSPDLQVSKPLQTANAGGYDAFVTQLGTAVSMSISGVLTLGTNQTFISAGNQATFTYTVTNNGPDLANSITVLDNLSASITGVPLTFVSASTSAGTCGGVSTNAVVSCSLPSLQSGSTAIITIVVTPTPNASGTQAFFNGGSVQVTAPGNIVLAQTQVPAQMSDFSVTVTPSNNSVPVAGDTATYQVQLSPHPVYGTNISLSCTGLPTASSCNFTSNPVTLQGPGSSTLNITTTARPISTSAGLLRKQLYMLGLMVPGLAFLGMGGSRRTRILGVLPFCALFALLLFLPACNKTVTQAPVSGTPAGNYTVTVTAISGSDTKSQTVTLTVP